MSYFGHVYPGLFHLLYGGIVLTWARGNRSDRELIALGSSKEIAFSAVYFFACFLLGIGIEGAGGVITYNDFFFQYSHQVSYVGYLVAGIVCVLELRGKLPRGAWKPSFAFAFFVEAWVMVGHLMMQKRVEATLHAIMVVMSLSIAYCLVMTAFSKQHGAFFQLCALGGILLKGLWFFYIAEIVYSGKFGIGGEEAHTGDLMATAGLMAVVCEAVVGLVLAVRCSNAQEEAVDLKPISPKEQEYVNVADRA